MSTRKSKVSCGAVCACQSGMARRDFMRIAGAAAVGAELAAWRAMAGPLSRADFERLVPADKKLRPEWVRSLFERGERTVYRGAELDKIGMPVGGLCAGQLYLGGDGRLWHWDIFNQRISTGADHYANPMKPQPVVRQGFAVRTTAAGKTQQRCLESSQWEDVAFIGEYPIGHVFYRDKGCPVTVSLEAFSPFIPLNVDDSSLPCTTLQFTLSNRGSVEARVGLAGWLENAVCRYSGQSRTGLLRNRIVRRAKLVFLECGAEGIREATPQDRPDIVFDDFEDGTYGKWSVTGTAFGVAPAEASRIPAYQGDVGGKGRRLVNSHASAPGDDVGARDNAHGRMVSSPFIIERNYLGFLIGGGAHKGRTCVNLLVDGKVVLSATGRNENRMRAVSWDVRRWTGQTAHIEIVDEQSGGWGNIGADDFVFSDSPRTPLGPLADESDFGTMGLALLDPQPGDVGAAALPADNVQESVFGTAGLPGEAVSRPLGETLLGSLGREVRLAAGESATVTFVLAWHFPNLKMDRLPPGRHYGTRFASALEVAEYVAGQHARLAGQTRLWHDTWYDSTLPHWFLDRTFLNTSILATSTCHRFADGRFYGWEGVGCCEGTCGHVWQYAHAVARLFPELERITRENVDFGLALQPDGAIHFRGEFNNIPAIDAQAGTVLRALREHQMSRDDAFLKANWPQIKRATEWLIAKDGNSDGLVESNQHNTLDTDWYGPVAWLSGLYLAALSAAEAMADEVGDSPFARKCRTIFDTGQKNLVTELFQDGYFVNKADPNRAEAINSGTGCHIDQVMGQSWAFQVHLPRVFPRDETLSALKALWRYSFTPDVGPYRQAYKPGRWYAIPGEAGLLMCTFPRSDWDYAQAKGKGPDWAAGYFNECMNGFEYQVAGHMIWEGMLTEGLAITRAVHDRYHAARRNPWNEIECGDHYARSMASYGVFLAACGYENHGPTGAIGFAPRLTPNKFKAAFTAPEGWGSYSQRLESGVQKCSIAVKWGVLRMRTLAIGLVQNLKPAGVSVTLSGKPLPAKLSEKDGRAEIQLDAPVTIHAGESLEIVLR